MDMETTLTAKEIRTVTVTLVDMSTYGTCLRGIASVNKNDTLTRSFCLVPEELFELIETPVAQLAVELGSSSLLHTDTVEVLDSEHSIVFSYDVLGYTVVYVCHKPSLSSAHRFEFATRGTSAFGLQLPSEFCVTTSNVFDNTAVVERVVAAYGDVVDATVNTENLNLSSYCGVSRLHANVQVERAIAVTQSRTPDIPAYVLLVVHWNIEPCSYPTTSSCNGDELVLEVNADNTLIIPHSAKALPLRNCFALCRLQRLASTVTSTLNEATREFAAVTDNTVRCLMVLDLVPSIVIVTPRCTGVERLGILMHGIKDFDSVLFSHVEFEGERTYHNHILNVLDEISFGGIRC